MIYEVSEKTARMLDELKAENGRQALSLLAIMWNEVFISTTHTSRSSKYSPMEGLSILTQLVVSLNEESWKTKESSKHAREYL